MTPAAGPRPAASFGLLLDERSGVEVHCVRVVSIPLESLRRTRAGVRPWPGGRSDAIRPLTARALPASIARHASPVPAAASLRTSLAGSSEEATATW